MCLNPPDPHSFPTRRSSDLPADWWGQEEVSFRATDPTGAIAEDTILVTLLRVDAPPARSPVPDLRVDRKSTRLNSSHVAISYVDYSVKKKLATVLPAFPLIC